MSDRQGTARGAMGETGTRQRDSRPPRTGGPAFDLVVSKLRRLLVRAHPSTSAGLAEAEPEMETAIQALRLDAQASVLSRRQQDAKRGTDYQTM